MRTGGSDTNGDSGHGSTLYNRYMMSYAAYGLYNATLDYFGIHPGVTQICTNDMALPFGGKFDIYRNWQSPHFEHDRGTAVDVAGPTSGQCPVPNQVNLADFLESCITFGAIRRYSIAEGNHAHCNWANPATYPH